MVELSVVLPCYNERGNLAEILRRYQSILSKLSFELILVDNGSNDGSRELLRELLTKPENQFARAVRIDRNIGYGFGLKTGLRAAQGTLLAISHADLQCSPEDLIQAHHLYRLQPRPSLVKGRRRDQRPWPDQFVTHNYNFLARALLGLQTGSKPPDVNAEPKLFPRSLVASLDYAPNDFGFDLYVLYAAKKAGLPILEFEVDYGNRVWGKSKLAANPMQRMETAYRAYRLMWRLRSGSK